jgi:hypothetical protein
MKKYYFLFFTLFAIFLITSCGNQSDRINPSDVVNNPNTANGTANTDDLPVFKFNEEEWDFGRIGQGEIVEHIFKFTNVGKSDLVILDAKATCGCTVADYPKTPIKPGKEGEVSVKFDSEGKKGMNNKSVTITANTQPNTKVLTIKANVYLPEE